MNKMPEPLEDFLAQGRLQVEDALDRAIPSLGTPPASLHHAVRRTLLLPGKRLRGVLVLAVSDLLRGPRETALPLACAVEMVHAASLILDDLPCMDNATLRRGKPVLHGVVGEATAILAAFVLVNNAFAVLQDAEGLSDRGRAEASRRLAAALGAEGLIGGQTIDLESTGRRLDLETLELVSSRKTGALFVAAAELGAVAGRGRPRDREALARYARGVGIAFQITDDLLGYSGNPETTGKDAELDRDKTTFVSLCGIDGARRLVDDLVDDALSALDPFGRRAAILRTLAEFVRGRDR